MATEIITQKHRDYWRKTQTLTAGLLGVWFLVTFVMGYFAKQLAEFNFFGWPFSFYMAAQGSLVIYIVIIWYYARRMAQLDSEFGVEEEDEPK